VKSRRLRIWSIMVLGHSLAVPLAMGCLTAVAASAATTTPRGAATTSPASLKPMIVTAAFSHIDYQTSTATFKDVTVVQGDTRLTAERAQATGLSFNDSRWTFGGNVVINVQPRGTLRSDRAVVQIGDNRITVVTITGHPALFEQQHSNSPGVVHGQADTIVYEANEDTARLTGNAWLSDGHNEISAPVIVYNFPEETMQARSGGGDRSVHIEAQGLPRGAAAPTAPRRRRIRSDSPRS